MASSFSNVLKNAAVASSSDRFFSTVMDRLVSMTCPQKSPKELMQELKESLANALGRKRISAPEIDAIYNAAVELGETSRELADFINAIEEKLAASNPRQAANFRKASENEKVQLSLREMLGRVSAPDKLQSATQNQNDGSVEINLNCRLQQTTGDSIEDAVRGIFFDIRKSRKNHGRADLVVGGKIVEIKYSRNMFSSLATDSQALYPNPDKWYLYIVGNAPIGETSTLKSWFMRSDKLYEAIASVNGSGIDVTSDTALDEIEKAVESLTRQLARAILNKSRPTGNEEPAPESMSLGSKVGINRVRFDIKFEGLLRAYVKEILRS